MATYFQDNLQQLNGRVCVQLWMDCNVHEEVEVSCVQSKELRKWMQNVIMIDLLFLLFKLDPYLF